MKTYILVSIVIACVTYVGVTRLAQAIDDRNSIVQLSNALQQSGGYREH